MARYFPGGGSRREAVARPESGHACLHTHTGTVLCVYTSIHKRVCLLSQAWIPPSLADSDCGLPTLASPGCHTTKRTESSGYRLAELNTGALPAAQGPWPENWKTSGLACHRNVGGGGGDRPKFSSSQGGTFNGKGPRTLKVLLAPRSTAAQMPTCRQGLLPRNTGSSYACPQNLRPLRIKQTRGSAYLAGGRTKRKSHVTPPRPLRSPGANAPHSDGPPRTGSGTGGESSLSLACKPAREGGGCLRGAAPRPVCGAPSCRGSLPAWPEGPSPLGLQPLLLPPALLLRQLPLLLALLRQPPGLGRLPQPLLLLLLPLLQQLLVSPLFLLLRTESKVGGSGQAGAGQGGRGLGRRGHSLAPVTSDVVGGRAQGHPKRGATVTTSSLKTHLVTRCYSRLSSGYGLEPPPSCVTPGCPVSPLALISSLTKWKQQQFLLLVKMLSLHTLHP